MVGMEDGGQGSFCGGDGYSVRAQTTRPLSRSVPQLALDIDLVVRVPYYMLHMCMCMS